MSETTSELLRFRSWIAIAILFLASMIYSCNEVRYRVFGRVADADILEIWQRQTKETKVTKGYEVKYRFTEEGGVTRTETDQIGSSWTPPSTPTVRVRYLKGSPEMSRLDDRSNWLSVIIFAGMCLVVIVKTILFMREYKADQAALARSRALSDVRYR